MRRFARWAAGDPIAEAYDVQSAGEARPPSRLDRFCDRTWFSFQWHYLPFTRFARCNEARAAGFSAARLTSGARPGMHSGRLPGAPFPGLLR